MADNLLDVEACLSKLSLQQKVKLLGGKNFMHFAEIPEADVHSIRCSDGPSGVRGEWVFNQLGANIFPAAIGLACTFDPQLITAVGVEIGKECRAKGVHFHMGPNINLIRSPLGGRNFECYSEDPHLAGTMGSALIRGVQSEGVISCPKHYVANDQEFERWSVDAVVPEHALRQLYLEPFRLVVKHSQPLGMMTAYNSVNGCHVSENIPLVKGILRDEWKYEGVVVSDWTGVYSTRDSLRATVDIEMPGPPVMRGKQTLRLVHAGKLQISEVDERARMVLRAAAHAKASGIPFDHKGHIYDTESSRTLLHTAAAETVVLLKNVENLLPLSDTRAGVVAIIGPNARDSTCCGGGSGDLKPNFKVSLLDAVKAFASSGGSQVKWAPGTHPFKYTPLADRYLSHPGGDQSGIAEVEFWNALDDDNWWTDAKATLPTASWHTSMSTMNEFIIDHIPRDIVGNNPKIRVTSVLTASSAGEWEISLASVGGACLYLDGVLLLENVQNYQKGDHFVGLGSKEVRQRVQFAKAGEQHLLQVRIWNDSNGPVNIPPEIPGGLRVGASPVIDEEEEIRAAAALAASCDTAIVMVGTSGDWEAEGADREMLGLPGRTDDLVRAVLKANKRTVVVIQTGSPCSMPWIDQAPAVVQAFFGGNAGGAGVADVLYGRQNPSGKLSVTFPKTLEDNPSAHSFGKTSKVPGKVMYDEGELIGYRHYDKHNVEPLFPFGHGLSYTTFEYSSLDIQTGEVEGQYIVSFTIRNTGKRAGKESAQVYISHPDHEEEGHPIKTLCGFAKTPLLQPSEDARLSCVLEKDSVSRWNANRKTWTASAGDYSVFVGSSSTKLLLEGKIVWKKDLNWLGL